MNNQSLIDQLPNANRIRSAIEKLNQAQSINLIRYYNNLVQDLVSIGIKLKAFNDAKYNNSTIEEKNFKKHIDKFFKCLKELTLKLIRFIND